MVQINDGGPAFPLAYTETNEHGMQFPFTHPGMSLRDWHAGQFLAGAAVDDGQALDLSGATDQFDVDASLRDYWGRVARTAYIAADAMLAARHKIASPAEKRLAMPTDPEWYRRKAEQEGDHEIGVGDRFYREPERPTHRHKKRGSKYVLVGIGKMQAEMWFEQGEGDVDRPSPLEPVDMREIAIYRSVDDGSLWARPREEFEDGQFEAVAKGGGRG